MDSPTPSTTSEALAMSQALSSASLSAEAASVGVGDVKPSTEREMKTESSTLQGVQAEEASGVAGTAASPTDEEPLVQYIILRKDLVDSLKWPLGSVMAQGCHAAVAAIALFWDNAATAEYCSSSNLDHMRKVVLEVKGEVQLVALAEKLKENKIEHKLWVEQPENYATCLATRPYLKSEVAQYFKKCKLCR